MLYHNIIHVDHVVGDNLGAGKYCGAGGGGNQPRRNQTEGISGASCGLSETSTQTNGKTSQADKFQNDQR